MHEICLLHLYPDVSCHYTMGDHGPCRLHIGLGEALPERRRADCRVQAGRTITSGKRSVSHEDPARKETISILSGGPLLRLRRICTVVNFDSVDGALPAEINLPPWVHFTVCVGAENLPPPTHVTVDSNLRMPTVKRGALRGNYARQFGA